MEVVVPLDNNFNFDSTCSSPYITAPSSPQRFGNFFFSAPPSPTSSIPFFDCEQKPGTHKSRNQINNNNNSQDFDFLDNNDQDFEFDFSGQLDRNSLSADELFDGGKIRPLKPPPGYDSSVNSAISSPRTPSISRKKDFDPFQAALDETRKRESKDKHQRGRERSSKSSNCAHKGSRSLSPLRVSDLMLEEDQEKENENSDNAKTSSTETTSTNAKSFSSFLSALPFSSKGYKKWKLKDLLLFRSASEGRATEKYPLTKYAVLSKREVIEDVKTSSFRSTEGSVGGSSRRRGRVSAHELHYTANRAVSEEMKRKTFLPYKHGLLGCLGFNQGVHDISRSIGSLTRG